MSENNIPKGWQKTTLGEVMNIYNGKTRPKKNGKYPIYGGNGILNYGDKFNQDDKTIIVGRVGAYCGNVFFEKNKFWLSDNALGIKNNDKSYIIFLFYKLKQMNLNNVAIGAAQPLLTQTLLKELKINLPPLSEQKAIAKILTAFDNKIELLEGQNKTLETIAQTVFKEWFGKYQIGDDLPAGWRVGKYGDLVSLSSGKGIKKTEYTETGEYDIIGANGVLGKSSKFLLNEKAIITGRVGTLGSVFIINKPVWISDNVLISKPKILNSFYYTYFILQRFNFKALNSGSTQPLITQNDLKAVEIIIPTKEILEKFEIISNSLFEKHKNNSIQIQTLKKQEMPCYQN